MNMIEKKEEVLGGKRTFLKGLKKVVVRDVGGERGAWGEEEKGRLMRECVRWVLWEILGVLGSEWQNCRMSNMFLVTKNALNEQGYSE